MGLEEDMAGIGELLKKEMHPRWQKVNRDVLGPTGAFIAATPKIPGNTFEEWVCKGLARDIRQTVIEIGKLRSGHEAFNSRHSALPGDEQKRENILEYAAELGRSPGDLKGDRKAFRRNFGHDAMVARFQRAQGDAERKLATLLERTGVVGRECLTRSRDPVKTWQDLRLEELATPFFEYDGDVRVATAGFQSLSVSIPALPEAVRRSCLSKATIQLIIRAAMDRERDVWLQSEGVRLLSAVDPESFRKVARLRLVDPPVGDDLWVRRRAIPVVVIDEKLDDLLDVLSDDPAPYVRQGLVENLDAVKSDDRVLGLLEKILGNDHEPAVRGSVLLKIRDLAIADRAPERGARLIDNYLPGEEDPWVIRVACSVISETHANLSRKDQQVWKQILYPRLNQLNQEHGKPSVRRWAAHAREKLWCHDEPGRVDLLQQVTTVTRRTRLGKSSVLKSHHAASLSDEDLGRVLSVAVQEDFGLDVLRKRNGFKLIRGDRFGFRLWRFFFEVKNASPDKRQAFRHTIGRIYDGRLRIPSVLLSEMSATKVPGEPLTISSEAGWRSMLPLVDEVISALDESSVKRPLKIVSSEGITVLKPPASTFQRLKAVSELNANFPRYALLRNSNDPFAYIEALRKLHISVEFLPHEGETVDPGVGEWFAHKSAMFPIAIGGFSIDELFSKIREYFYSAYSNSLEQLFIFLLAASGYFIGRHVYFNQVFFRLRGKIPLIVGGWGTRGKSGTERIKAALFNALGHRMVSKTTGCEAMFLYADSFGKTHELFLFRPYDKATIWEQVNIVNLCARLGSHVFLWECMGLTPAYINIIQRQWMNDDIATIVNTYPDHENLQGPAGINIPQVMTYFVRTGGHCITSEQQMTPILEQEALEVGSEMTKVGWLEPGLLTPDVVDRFPYAEHPNNIALVTELGNQLAMAPDFCIKEMSDRVVPDLGVLKVYAPACIQGRRLQFVNGCSANERFGALGNWTRLEYDKHDPRKEPGTWISVVVNNRADRVPRSRVFAAILADDIYVDRVFLIGSNLQGMQGYTREAFEARTSQMSLYADESKAPEEVFREWALLWRQPTTEEELKQYLDAMDSSVDISEYKAPCELAFKEYQEMVQTIKGSTGNEALDKQARALLWTWFERRFVIVHDYFSTGDQTMNVILRETPPGYLHKIMGMQNIKGTGLDFVYRWQAWDNCYNACRMIRNRKIKIAREGLAVLASFKDFGIICEEEVNEAVKEGIKLHGAKDRGLKDQLLLIQSGMDEILKGIKATLGASDSDSSSGRFGAVKARAIKFVESCLDGGDAIRRRKTADQVYKDMANLRIGPAIAAQEIQRLNKRQKGGWLTKAIDKKLGKQ